MFHHHSLIQKAASNDNWFSPFSSSPAMDALETALSRWAARQVGAPGRLELETIENRICCNHQQCGLKLQEIHRANMVVWPAKVPFWPST